MARIIISLSHDLLSELDKYATQNMYNRSECIRHAIRSMMQEKGSDVSQEHFQEENNS